PRGDGCGQVRRTGSGGRAGRAAGPAADQACPPPGIAPACATLCNTFRDVLHEPANGRRKVPFPSFSFPFYGAGTWVPRVGTSHCPSRTLPFRYLSFPFLPFCGGAGGSVPGSLPVLPKAAAADHFAG